MSLSYKMAWEHYGFDRDPFNALASWDQHFETGAFSMVKTVMAAALEQKTMHAIVAPQGYGKSTSVAKVIDDWNHEKPRALIIRVAPADPKKFKTSDVNDAVINAAQESGLRAARARARIPDHIRRQIVALQRPNLYPDGVLIVIDNAHAFSTEALRGIRQLVENTLAVPQHHCGVVFVGWRDLEVRISMMDDVQLRTQVHQLKPMTKTEVKNFITHRILSAGGNPDIIENDSIEYIAERTRDVKGQELKTPAEILKLLQKAMDEGAKIGKQTLTVELFYQADRSNQPLKALWKENNEPGLKLIGEEVGLSKSEVSRYINDPMHGDPSKIRQIAAAIRRLSNIQEQPAPSGRSAKAS